MICSSNASVSKIGSNLDYYAYVNTGFVSGDNTHSDGMITYTDVFHTRNDSLFAKRVVVTVTHYPAYVVAIALTLSLPNRISVNPKEGKSGKCALTLQARGMIGAYGLYEDGGTCFTVVTSLLQ